MFFNVFPNSMKRLCCLNTFRPQILADDEKSRRNCGKFSLIFYDRKLSKLSSKLFYLHTYIQDVQWSESFS